MAGNPKNNRKSPEPSQSSQKLTNPPQNPTGQPQELAGPPQKPATLQSSTEPLRQIVEPLLDWYDKNARDLPWRMDSTPYRVWVSEIMLQQTRVSAVIPYYERFLAALPDLRALAACDQEVLHKLWQGLGYYSRARNMQRAAQMMVERYEGEFPPTYDEILALPGVGEYTAGAVASIALGIRVPAVDGNVLRVLSRWTNDDRDIEKSKGEYRARLSEVLPERVGDFNQALMELGATVCIPRGKPLCETCPIAVNCRGNCEKTAENLPKKAKKSPKKVKKRAVFLLFFKGKIALRKRGKGLLAGLWEFPGIDLDELPPAHPNELPTAHLDDDFSLLSNPPNPVDNPVSGSATGAGTGGMEDGSEAPAPVALPLRGDGENGTEAPDSIRLPVCGNRESIAETSNPVRLPVCADEEDKTRVQNPVRLPVCGGGEDGTGVPASVRLALHEWGIAVSRIAPGIAAKHVFTHVEWLMQSYAVEVEREDLPEGWAWAGLEELEAGYPLPSAFSAFLPAVRERLKNRK